MRTHRAYPQMLQPFAPQLTPFPQRSATPPPLQPLQPHLPLQSPLKHQQPTQQHRWPRFQQQHTGGACCLRPCKRGRRCREAQEAPLVLRAACRGSGPHSRSSSGGKVLLTVVATKKTRTATCLPSVCLEQSSECSRDLLFVRRYTAALAATPLPILVCIWQDTYLPQWLMRAL